MPPTSSTPPKATQCRPSKTSRVATAFDYSFEAVGTPQTLLQALSSSRPSRHLHPHRRARPHHGGGTAHAPVSSALAGPLRVSWYGDCLAVPADFPMLAGWYSQGQLDLDRVVSRIISIGETEEAF